MTNGGMTNDGANEYALGVTYAHALDQVQSHCRSVDRYALRSRMEYVFEPRRIDSKRAEDAARLAVAWLGAMGLLWYPAAHGEGSPEGISDERFRVLPLSARTAASGAAASGEPSARVFLGLEAGRADPRRRGPLEDRHGDAGLRLAEDAPSEDGRGDCVERLRV